MTNKQVASLIIIGDEILRGQVQDSNTIYLAKSLKSIGIKIRRVTIIPDEIDIIAKEVSEASTNFPIVFTAGGVGPTHDDVTYEGIAKGFGLSLETNAELLANLVNLFPDKQLAKRLATVPSSSELIQVTSALEEKFKVIKVKNVYVLPGSPHYFCPAVDKIVQNLDTANQLIHFSSIDLNLSELQLVDILDKLAKYWSGSVSIGSYPQYDEKRWTRITFEGMDYESVTEAKKQLINMLSKDNLLTIKSPHFDVEQAEKVYESAKEMNHVRHALRVLEECYSKYEDNEVFLSFNGGKDCTVVLHLTAALIQLRKFQRPLCLYVTGNAFPEVEEFVNNAAIYYGFEIITLEGPIKHALINLLKKKPKLKACLMGVRKNDPGAETLNSFTMTDPEWPQLMRVSPIIDWSYKQIWEFILKHDVPYCSLYDKGYTSLGGQSATKKNPLLQDPNDPSKYLPAHTLADDSAERHGRT